MNFIHFNMVDLLSLYCRLTFNRYSRSHALNRIIAENVHMTQLSQIGTLGLILITVKLLYCYH